MNKREKIFASGNYLYFAYFLRRVWKGQRKILKTPICIYYLVIIIIPKETERIPINELVTTIKMGAEDFTKKIAEKTGIDSEEEEFLGVDNIIKSVDLERRLEEKENVIKEKNKQLKEKEKEIKQLKKQLDKIKK